MIISDSGRKPFTSHNIRGLPDWQSDQLTNRTEPFLIWDLDMKVENAHKSHTNSITLLLWSLQHKVRYPPEHKKRKKEKNGYMNGSAAMYSARLKWRYTANNIHVAMARHDGILSQQGLSMADTFHRRSVGMASLLSRRWGKAVTSFRLQDTRISRRIKVSLLGSWHQEVTQGTLTPFLKQRAEGFPRLGRKRRDWFTCTKVCQVYLWIIGSLQHLQDPFFLTIYKESETNNFNARPPFHTDRFMFWVPCASWCSSWTRID